MKQVVDMLSQNSRVSDYKLYITRKESYELFFVKGKLETVRRTDTTDCEVTVYVDHDGYKGDAQFFIYPATTTDEIAANIDEAVEKALLINNQNYLLPVNEQGKYEVESNFAEYEMSDMAAQIAQAVFSANKIDHASLNAVEIFINKYTEKVFNSRDLCKTQVRYHAMVEAIPTYNGVHQSVELYEQYNFSSLDERMILKEIAEKMEEVKARYEAITPDFPIDCNVILNQQELAELFSEIAYDLNYSSVYSHFNLFQKGDLIQKSPDGDVIGIAMAGEVPGNIRSGKFDSDGVSLGRIRLVEKGQAVNYYGANRYGQYLGEIPTGELRCLCVDAGTADAAVFQNGPYLEVISMSGLQVDFYTDYIGGEVRLAYYHDGCNIVPVTGISISGQLSEVLEHIRLSAETTTYDGYTGPAKALLSHMKVY